MQKKIMYGDFETRSEETIAGSTYRYASHDSTEVMMFGYMFPGEKPELCYWGDLPGRVREHVKSGGIIRAFNATFERLIWNLCAVEKYGWPEARLEQFECVAFHARTHRIIVDVTKGSTLAGLDDVCRFLNLPGKDVKGAEALKKFYSPMKYAEGKPVWYDNKDDFESMANYCKQDVRLLPLIEKQLFPVPQSEIDIYHINERINDRGVKVNLDLCHAAINKWEELSENARKELYELTDGQVTAPTQNVKILQYINDNRSSLDEAHDSLTTLKLENITDPKCARVFEIRKKFARSVMGKFKKIIQMTDDDGRYRGAHIYYGAGTGRMSGYGVQLQNLMSPLVKQDQIDLCRAWLLNPEIAPPPEDPEKAIPSCIRSVIEADTGKMIVSTDLAGIEMRVLPWLAGATKKLDLIRTGADIYKITASGIYGIPVEQIEKTSTERKAGKVAELALGFQGSVGAILKFALKENMDFTADEMKAMVKAFRTAEHNLPIVDFWKALQKAAVKAIEEPGKWFYAGQHIAFRSTGRLLVCALPSIVNGDRRYLFYPYPQVKMQSFYVKWDEEKEEEVCRAFLDDPGPPWEPVSKGKVATFQILTRSGRQTRALYGGFAAENVTQAVAGDILIRNALPLAERSANMSVMFLVHDELNIEAQNHIAAKEELESYMTTAPDWAEGLPLGAETWVYPYFKK